MPLEIGIVGLPNVGKSTLFNALTQAGATVAVYPFTTIEPNRGIVTVPDARLTRLAAMVNANRDHPVEKVTPATVEFVDIAGLVRGAHRGEGLGNQFLGHIRPVDAIALVCRCFEDPNVAHVDGSVDPLRDAEVLDLELTLADLEVTERRQEKVRTMAKSNPREYAAELEALETLQARLHAGDLVSDWVSPGSLTAQLAQEISLLTAKARIYVANVGESDLPDGRPLAEMVSSRAKAEGAAFVLLCAQLESDLGEWPPDEAVAYRAEVGLARSGLETLARAGYAVLDLITFFTITGGEEVRAWAIPRGTKASQAAGKVHTQMEQGFIRAEVAPCETLVELGSWSTAREKGVLHVEGRDYVVQDGDVCLFRFSP
ncbi:MAG TPA: redox-regulated ATPase YchF [Chloroflexi bacterium]|nr:redox-regulated ATPase YchF [Chloroflexota bacterium]